MTTVAESGTFKILCPCCEATLTIELPSRQVIFHRAKPRSAAPGTSFEELLTGLDKQKSERDQTFEREMTSMKDRERLLEEKFKQAVEHAKDTKDEPLPPRDIDLD